MPFRIRFLSSVDSMMNVALSISYNCSEISGPPPSADRYFVLSGGMNLLETEVAILRVTSQALEVSLL